MTYGTYPASSPSIELTHSIVGGAPRYPSYRTGGRTRISPFRIVYHRWGSSTLTNGTFRTPNVLASSGWRSMLMRPNVRLAAAARNARAALANSGSYPWHSPHHGA